MSGPSQVATLVTKEALPHWAFPSVRGAVAERSAFLVWVAHRRFGVELAPGAAFEHSAGLVVLVGVVPL